MLQDIQGVWPGGPIVIKIAIVSLGAFLISYGLSLAIKKFPRGSVGTIIALLVAMIIAF